MTNIIKNVSEEFSKGNFAAAYEHFADDASWHIVGDKTISGRKDLIAFCGKMKDVMDGTLQNTNILIEGERIAIEGYCDYVDADWKPAKLEYCDVYRFADGKLLSVVSYCSGMPNC